ncbi:MAG: hypothetical protein R3195_05775 [Gemmatimonadota bacterium]|nr:hypothetical protein [Gemmatimonadota bacterium]
MKGPLPVAVAIVLASCALADAGRLEAQPVTPEEYLALVERADSLGRAARFAEAAEAYRRVVAINPYDDRLWLELARYSRQSDRADEARALERAIELGSDQRSRLMVRLAGVYAELERPEEAFEWLERALDDRLETRPSIATMRQFEPYRDDPRFRELAGIFDPITDRDEGWRTDLAWLVTEVKRLHAGPDRPALSPEFDRAVARLHERIPELDDEGVALELQRLMVMLGDGHSALWSIPNDRVAFTSLPIDFYWFSDGIFVTAGDGAAADRVGDELVAIGGIPVADLVAGAEAFITRDNPMGTRAAAPSLLRRMSVLRELGAAPDLSGAELELRAPDGTTRALRLEAAGYRSAWRPGPLPGRESETPLWLRGGSEIHMEELADGALYVRYPSVSNPEGSTLEAFAGTLDERLERGDVRHVVFDIRRNGGGNNFLNWPLVRSLILFEAGSDDREILVLAGRHTFSAAQNFANWVNRLTDAVFIGEPTGSAANFTGETTPVELPFSGLRASVSSRYWQDSHATDTRVWIAPDVPIELDSGSFSDNRDPVIEYVLRRVGG